MTYEEWAARMRDLGGGVAVLEPDPLLDLEEWAEDYTEERYMRLLRENAPRNGRRS